MEDAEGRAAGGEDADERCAGESDGSGSVFATASSAARTVGSWREGSRRPSAPNAERGGWRRPHREVRQQRTHAREAVRRGGYAQKRVASLSTRAARRSQPPSVEQSVHGEREQAKRTLRTYRDAVSRRPWTAETTSAGARPSPRVAQTPASETRTAWWMEAERGGVVSQRRREKGAGGGQDEPESCS